MSHFSNIADDREATGRRMPRRAFMRSATAGAAGLALSLGSAGRALAGVKDSGEVTLDALLITYFSPPLGTLSSAFYTFETAYTTTIGLRSLANPDITLKARISAGQERINGASAIRQAMSAEVKNGMLVFPRPRANMSFTTGTNPPGLPENVTFEGLYRPRLRFKGDGRKAQFQFVDASGSFAFGGEELREVFSAETADSIIRQYVYDPASLVEPRFIRTATVSGGPSTFTAVAERGAPKDLTSTVTARIIEQTGFESDVLKEAFAVGSDLEVTYYSAQESRGEILKMESAFERETPGSNTIYWDRVFKTFVIIDGR
jgi:hypothetical protein